MRKLTVFPALLLVVFANAQVKPTPASERMKSVEQRAALEQKSVVNDVSFRNIGPTVMSGRVVDIEVNFADPTEFYVAYASGGLWHTTNNGQSFTPIFDSEAIMTIGDIAVNWSNRTIWVGTGEVNSSRSSYAGIGLYKSTNNGKSWEYLGLPESHHIGKIQLHPTDPNTAWVAALGHLYSPNKERGVYKTTDGGKTWKLTLAIDENTGAVDLEMNHDKPNELYAAMWYRTRRAWNFEEGGKTSGIYKSTDGGETWKLVSGPSSGFATGDGIGRIGLSMAWTNTNTIYAIVDNQNKKEGGAARPTSTGMTIRDFKGLSKDQFLQLDEKRVDSFLRNNRFPAEYTFSKIKEKVGKDEFKPSVIYDYLKGPNDDLLDASNIIGCEIYRSDDGGATWKKTNTKDLPNMYSTYGYYFGKVFVSPTNIDKIVITGVPIMMSVDGGKTFTNIDGDNVHSDHHFVWMNYKRDSHMIIGNDGGVNITYDDGKNWYKANSIPVGQFYSVFVDEARPYNVYGGLQDNGVWYGPSTNRESSGWHDNGNYAFKMIGGGDGMQVQVDTRDNNTFYAGSQFGSYFRNNKQGTQRLPIRPRHQLGETPLRFNWETPIWLSKHNQDIFYIGSNRVHRSFNKAENLQNVSPDLTKGGISGDVPYGTLTCLIESPIRFGLLYTGSDDGLVHVSKDGGYTWTNITGKLPKDLWVSS
ncbi:MAG TPA: glycosyl hydrolase, partial [Chitinophagaceae bacterium]|nr:glycosyl hydrolase [Chitinophagaceae bacterium]